MHEGEITFIASHPTSKGVAVGTQSGKVYFYNIKQLKTYGHVQLDEGIATSGEFSRDGSSLIIGTTAGSVINVTSTNWEIFTNLVSTQLVSVDKDV